MANLDVKLDIVDHSLLNCSDHKYRARPIITVMNYKSTLKRYCREDRELQNCSCHISFLRLDENTNAFHPMYSVNCSGAEFWDFPKQLPENTTTLYITHNNVRHLHLLNRYLINFNSRSLVWMHFVSRTQLTMKFMIFS